MNKRLLGILACGGALLATGMAVTSCSDDVDYGGDGRTGRVHLQLAVDASANSRSRATLEEIGTGLTADDFTVRLEPADGGDAASVREWPFNDFDGADIKTGSYILTAFYGEEGREGFDCPYFVASQRITVEADRTTNVSLTASLGNCAVEVVYTEAFAQYMTSYEANVRTEGQTSGIAYPATAAGELFVNPGLTSLYVTFTTPTVSDPVTVRVAEFDAVARNKYVVTVNVNEGAIGNAVLNVTFNDDTVSEDFNIELSDELLKAPAPTITPLNYSFDVIEGAALPSKASFSIMARSGLARVTMTTEGDWLLAQGWPAEIDLLHADAAQQSKLKELGMSALGLWNNPDKMAVVDVTSTLAKIRSLDGNGATTRMMIEVEDKYGKVTSQPALLEYAFTPISIEITGNEYFFPDASKAVVDLEYTGTDPQNEISWEYLTNRGVDVWDPITPTSITAVARAANAYRVEFAVPSSVTGDFTVRASFDAERTVTYVVKRGEPTFTITATAANTWAYTATAAITPTTSTKSADELIAACDWTYSVDNGTTWKACTAASAGSGNVLFSGLPDGKTMKIKGFDGSSEIGMTTLTTEAALQLPASTFDSEYWREDPTTDGKTSNNYKNYTVLPEGVWGTNNPMTTSQGSNYQYCRISGTTLGSSSDAHAGSGCAVLRSVGWGSGNTAAGNLSSRVMKYADAGLLHLGASRTARPSGYSSVTGPLTTDDLATGYAFASRPKSISFYYKYSAKGSGDQGSFEYWIKDASDNTIASGSLTLSATAWTQQTVNISYPANAPKGAKIYVKFLSTNDGKYLAKDTNYFNSPGFGNLSDGKYDGSYLYIDDIVLNY